MDILASSFQLPVEKPSPFSRLLHFEGQRKQLHGGGESTTYRKEAAEQS